MLHHMPSSFPPPTHVLLLPQAHSNFAEFAPYALLMLALVEHDGVVSTAPLHALGGALLIGRTAHAAAFTRDDWPAQRHFSMRTLGMVLTTTTMGILASLLLKRGIMG
jgi:uncharacterized membrane protein YecN with MAPEG domain